MRLRRCWWWGVAVHWPGAGAVKTLGASPYLWLDLRQLRHRLHFCQHPWHYDSWRLCLYCLSIKHFYIVPSIFWTDYLKKFFQLVWYLLSQVHCCHDMCDVWWCCRCESLHITDSTRSVLQRGSPLSAAPGARHRTLDTHWHPPVVTSPMSRS